MLKQNFLGTLGFSVFQNFGFLCVLTIFVLEWSRGNKLSLGDSFALLAMIFFLFMAINSMTFYSMSTCLRALTVIERVSEVLEMEEHKFDRELTVKDDEPCI